MKILVTGGRGTGKSTFIAAVSDVASVAAEATVTPGDSPVVDGHGTTVAMDFGRTDVGGKTLYLFGTPGQDRFWFMWDRLADGARGALVLTDPRRVADSSRSVGFLADRRVPFVVVANGFEGSPRRPPSQIRSELGLRPKVPVVSCDARERGSAMRALDVVRRHVLEQQGRRERGGAPAVRRGPHAVVTAARYGDAGR